MARGQISGEASRTQSFTGSVKLLTSTRFGDFGSLSLLLLSMWPRVFAFVCVYPFSCPEPVVFWSRGLEWKQPLPQISDIRSRMCRSYKYHWSCSFSSPEPVVSWSRGRLQIKPSGSGDEHGSCS